MDQALFHVVNDLPHTAFLNDIARFFSGIGSWGAIWFFIAVILFFREEKKDHWFFLPSILATGMGILLSEILLKNIIMRPRPPGAYLLDYSFPSTHATIAWAMAYVLWREDKKLRPWLIILATLISLSRIYLGVHYPSDVIAGSLIGIGIGLFSLWVETKIKH
jgi:undecaprenyl-diphosphatase